MTLAHAIETGDLAQLPGRRDEDWRWTDLRGLIRAEVAASPKADEAAPAGGPFAGLAEAEVALVNGRLNVWPDAGDAGAVQVAVHASPDNPAGRPFMARLAADRASEPPAVILTFRAGEEAAALVRLISAAAEAGHHGRVGVLVEAGANATLLESYEGQGAGYFSNILVELFVSPGASLERIVVADDDEAAIGVSTALVALAPGSRYAQTILTTGAKRQRFETQLTHPGGGASARLDGAYLVGARRHADLTSVVTHRGYEGATSELIKGAIAGQGRGVFQGRILVEKGADKTDARMGHHALVLSDQAEVDAKPELLIFADDVACAHGNTVGQLDEQAIFYAMQRGLPEAEARAMLTEAFVGEVIDRIEHEGARDVARAWLAEKLRGLVE